MAKSELVQELDDISALFVQTAHGFDYADGRVTLRGVTPSTLYFSDRPKRVVGHVGTPEFVGIWGDGENSFAEDPPNAVLTFIQTGDETPEDVVIIINDPWLADGNLSYSAEVTDGTLPPRGDACTLFIDPFGNPLSPVSVAGINRRNRRRGRR